MDYIKIRFTHDFDQLGTALDKTLEGVLSPSNPVFSLARETWKPPMDLCETPEEVIILGETAGVEKQDLELEICSRAVRIRGRRKPFARLPNTSYRRAEIQFGPFERILALPALIDPDRVSAAYSNGMLEIRLAKLALDKVHAIPITDG